MLPHRRAAIANLLIEEEKAKKGAANKAVKAEVKTIEAPPVKQEVQQIVDATIPINIEPAEVVAQPVEDVIVTQPAETTPVKIIEEVKVIPPVVEDVIPPPQVDSKKKGKKSAVDQNS